MYGNTGDTAGADVRGLVAALPLTVAEADD
jgi:hypothetical protein